MSANVLQRFNDQNLGKFIFLKEFSLKKTTSIVDRSTSCEIEMLIVDRVEENEHGLRIQFFHVTDLAVGDLNGTVSSAILISDISSWMLEKAKFKVTDGESNIFSFNCQDFLINRQ